MNRAMLNFYKEALLNDYISLAPQTANRQHVLVLLSHLNQFGMG